VQIVNLLSYNFLILYIANLLFLQFILLFAFSKSWKLILSNNMEVESIVLKKVIEIQALSSELWKK
jgi:hypothetical protein